MSTHRSSYLEGAILAHQTGGAALSRPTTLYLAFLTASDVEPGIGANYARISITMATGFGAPTTVTNGRQIANTGALTGTQNNSAGSLGTMTQWALYDASSGGNQWYKGPLDSSFDYDPGLQPTVAIGACKIQLIRVDLGDGLEGGTDALFDLELNHVRNTATWAQPTFSMGLLTTYPSNPGNLTGLVEVTGGSYARQSMTFSAPDSVGTTVTDGRAAITSNEQNFGANDIGSSQSVVGWGLHDGTAFRYTFRDAVTWGTSQTLRYPSGSVYLGAR